MLRCTKFCSAFAIVLFVLVGAGAQSAYASTWRNSTTITKVQFSTNGVAFFQIAASEAGENCQANDWIIISPSTGGYSQQVQAVLAAYLGGKTINVNMHLCLGYPSGGTTYPIPRYIELNP
jgi:hypothetical protein